MCVICIKTAGHKMPTKSELKAMYMRNPDGCGFVSEHDHFKTLDFDEFYARVKKVKKDENCIMHFRIATHGAVNMQNCHPFYDERTRTWFMHNGILRITPYKGKTDSETAFRKYLAPTILRHGLYSHELKTVVNNIIDGSRFAFMQDGMIKTFGKFYEHNGCFYSNLYHLPYTTRYENLDFFSWRHGRV